MKLAKQILGCRRTTSNLKVRGILHWTPLLLELDIKKLTLWQKWTTHPIHKLTAEALEHCGNKVGSFSWYDTITQLITQYHHLLFKEGTHVINYRKALEKEYWKQWSIQIREKTQHDPYLPGEGIALDISYPLTERYTAQQIRIGDTMSILGSMTCDVCPVCEQQLPKRWQMHIMTECRGRGYSHPNLNLTLSTLSRILMGEDKEAFTQVIRAFHQWGTVTKRVRNN